MTKKLYKTLNISENSDASEIKKAYRKLAKEYHPDINKDPHAEEKFKEINAAYEILSDSNKKQQYDRFGDDMLNDNMNHGFHQSHGDDIEEMLRNMFTGGFGRGFHRQQQPDLQVRVGIPLHKAINGGQLVFSLQGEEIKVNIPKGIKNGTNMRVAGKGNIINGKPGDLYINIIIQSEGNFTVHGNDLLTFAEIDLKTAIFGGQQEIDLFGEKIKYTVPKNIKFGQKLRVNKGLVDGSLYIELHIKLPSAEERPDLEAIL